MALSGPQKRQRQLEAQGERVSTNEHGKKHLKLHINGKDGSITDHLSLVETWEGLNKIVALTSLQHALGDLSCLISSAYAKLSYLS